MQAVGCRVNCVAWIGGLNSLSVTVPPGRLAQPDRPGSSCVPQTVDVSRPNFFSSEVLVGIGTRLDLSGIPNILTLPNGASDPGTLTYDALTGASTLTLPIEITLPELGIPEEILDLDLGFSGQLVASGTVTIPEPTGISLLACAAVGMLSLRRRSA